MCGIAGIATTSMARPDAQQLLAEMGRRIAHRGPDDTGQWNDEHNTIYFCHKRLAVIDLSPAAHQPMCDHSGRYVIVFNGEIYNFLEIRRSLEAGGVTFRSRSDTEVIIEGYKRWGKNVVQKLRGMFAFALWDGNERKLLLVRDRLGKKPLYYWQSPDATTFLFGSEIKALLSYKNVARTMNPIALSSYVQLGYVIGTQTMFRDVRKVAPGTILERSQHGAIHEERYWRITEMGTDHRPRAVVVSELRERLSDAVRMRLISDVPVGAFLSGGLDSTINVAFMSRFLNRPVDTFTVSHSIGPRSIKYNVDARHAKVASEFYHTNHHELVLEHAMNIESAVHDVLRYLDEPYANYSYLSTFGLAHYIKKNGVTVVLSGDGSDELFGGYAPYALERWVSRLRKLPRAARQMLSWFSPAIAKGVAKSFAQETSPEMYFNWRRQIPLSYLNDPQLHPEFLHEVATVLQEAPTTNAAERLMYADLRMWIAEESNMRMDKLNMASAVESRAPFLDHELVEFAFRIPLQQKIRGRTGKTILREAIGSLLPDVILRRPKWGFFAPVHYWMKDRLPSLVRSVLTEDNVSEAGIFRPDRVGSLVASGQHPFTVWSLLTFHLWHTTYIRKQTLP